MQGEEREGKHGAVGEYTPCGETGWQAVVVTVAAVLPVPSPAAVEEDDVHRGDKVGGWEVQVEVR